MQAVDERLPAAVEVQDAGARGLELADDGLRAVPRHVGGVGRHADHGLPERAGVGPGNSSFSQSAALTRAKARASSRPSVVYQRATSSLARSGSRREVTRLPGVAGRVSSRSPFSALYGPGHGSVRGHAQLAEHRGARALAVQRVRPHVEGEAVLPARPGPPAGLSERSSTSTASPSRARYDAAARPASPPPTTRASHRSLIVIASRLHPPSRARRPKGDSPRLI